MESETKSRRTRLALIAVILLLLGSLMYLFILKEQQKILTGDLEAERLKSESLLSEKLLHEKENVKINSELEAATQTRSELLVRLKETQEHLQNILGELEKNKISRRTLHQAKNQLQGSQQRITDLEKEREENNRLLSASRTSGKDLEIALAQAQEHNRQLSNDLAVLLKTSLDNSLAQSLKKNQKLTVKAKRTNELIIQADVFGSTENIGINVTTPEGKELKVETTELTITSAATDGPTNQPFYVSASPHSVSLQKNRTEIIYKPKNKLKPGLYKIVIDNSNSVVGSLQVKLR